MYEDLRPASLARVIIGIMPIVGYNHVSAIREAFDPQLLDPGIVFDKSYLDSLAVACHDLWSSTVSVDPNIRILGITLSEWKTSLYIVNDERTRQVPVTPAIELRERIPAGIPKWAVAVIVFLGGLLLVSKKRS